MFTLMLPLTSGANCYSVATLENVYASGVSMGGVTIPTESFSGLRIINERIDAKSGISTTLVLCDDSMPNAFATRNRGRNVVGITVGMMKLLGNDWHAYAAIVGHENAHLVKNHGRKRQKREGVLALGRAILQSTLPQGAGVLAPTIVDYGIVGLSARYSQKEELEADQVGMELAYCAGFSAEGALSVHRKLDSKSSFFSSHPSSKNRIARLRVAISAQKRNPACR